MVDHGRMVEIVSGRATISDQIRALNAAGFSRSEIAKFLGKRYQQVRNVLVQDEIAKNGKGAARKAAFKEALPDRLEVRVGPGGRIVIPAVFREAMRVTEGESLMARVVEGELRLITPRMAVKRAQKWVRETIPADVDLVADLLEERRREFEREASDG